MANWPFDHYKRWNIEYSSKESFEKFKYRMYRYFQETSISKSEAVLYNFLIGSRIADDVYGSTLGNILSQQLALTEYVTRVQTTLEMYERREDVSSWQHVCEGIQTCLAYSPDIGIDFYKDEKIAFLYPKGAELLGSGLIKQI